MPVNATPQLLTITQASSRINICRTAIYNLMKTGQLHKVKIGRKTLFAESEISDFITQRIAGN